MSYRLIVTPEAEVDLAAAFDWYEEQLEGLGHEFLVSVRAVFERVEKTPLAYQMVFEQFRRAKIKRFPFGILYVLQDTSIYVVGVMHTRRDPEGWVERLNITKTD